MSLSPANLEVLQGVRAHLLSRKALLDLSLAELAEAHKFEAGLDAKAYAGWAGRQMVCSMNASQADLIAAKQWYEKKLRKGYLVQRDQVGYAFQVAVRFAGSKRERRLHGEEE
jgi:hypothetical protein